MDSTVVLFFLLGVPDFHKAGMFTLTPNEPAFSQSYAVSLLYHPRASYHPHLGYYEVTLMIGKQCTIAQHDDLLTVSQLSEEVHKIKSCLCRALPSPVLE